MVRRTRWSVVGRFLLVSGLSLAATPLYLLDRADRPPAAPSVVLLAGGDVMVARHIGVLAGRRGLPALFEGLRGLAGPRDIFFANLESPLGPAGLSPAFPEKPFNFLGSTGTAAALKESGFTLVSMANNHGMDYGPEAIAHTTNALTAAGVAWAGVGADATDARALRVLERRGIRFGFLAYADAHSPRVFADRDRAGVSGLRPAWILEDIARWRSRVDVLVVSLHWGIEYADRPTDRQQRLARRIIDAGADVVLGHHPHVFQGLEEYNGGLIVYSLGNLLFDQRGDRRDQNYLVRCVFRGGRRESTALVPLARRDKFIPVRAASEEAADILAEASRRSAPLQGTMPAWLPIPAAGPRPKGPMPSRGFEAPAPPTVAPRLLARREDPPPTP